MIEDFNRMIDALHEEEVEALWAAMQRGFLVCAGPSDFLIKIYALHRCVVNRPGVILLPRLGEIWKIVVSAPDLSWFPSLIQQLCELGVLLRTVRPTCGVVSALVSRGDAEAIASAVLGRRGTELGK